MMELIDFCVDHSIDEVLALPDVKERVDLYFEQQELFKKQLAEIAEVHDKVVVIDLREQEKNLYNTIEGYWIEGMTNQSNFKAAREATKSQEASYELLSEQFRLGLKNIVELMTGKTNLVNAQQNELQSKYLTILDIYLLKLYQR